MKTKHTSGPWQVAYYAGGDGNGGYASSHYTIQKGEKKIVKTINAVATEADEANAARIASCVNACEGINPDAVPDMLEALKELLAMGQDGIIQRNETGKPTWSILDAIKTITQAAISKAEGNG